MGSEQETTRGHGSMQISEPGLPVLYTDFNMLGPRPNDPITSPNPQEAENRA